MPVFVCIVNSNGGQVKWFPTFSGQVYYVAFGDSSPNGLQSPFEQKKRVVQQSVVVLNILIQCVAVCEYVMSKMLLLPPNRRKTAYKSTNNLINFQITFPLFLRHVSLKWSWECASHAPNICKNEKIRITAIGLWMNQRAENVKNKMKR